ncbi:hypothetical protein [Halorussus marinus]|uniref:hypothetical protein n=1 Tax=Halorussus marinus TaxID=2505976 RepID=UPI001092D9F5|nr:hypothetical protein [Halorussus marinus]
MDEIIGDPGLTDFDARAGFEAVRAAADSDLRAFVEYDGESYNPVFIAERVVEKHGDPEEVGEFADRLHFNYKLDFAEREMYEDLYEPLGSITAFAVYLTDQTIVRYVDEREGIYVSVDGETHADEVIEALADALGDRR